jgi:small acid-soluble spore protein P (minor)
MPKTNMQPLNPPEGQDHQEQHTSGGQPEPLSGSKKVKNRNHSRANHTGRNT